MASRLALTRLRRFRLVDWADFGGILAYFDWRLVFLVSVPVAIAGTIWAYTMLRETTKPRSHQKIDWLGNVTFAIGATILLIGITYGIEPYAARRLVGVILWVSEL